MKIVFLVTLILAIIDVAILGSLTIFEVLSGEEGMDLGKKSLAVILLLGVASAFISLASGSKSDDE